MPHAQHLTIALAEPSQLQAQIIRHALSELGICNVEVFHSGQALLQQLQSHAPDVVISALYLPDMTGTELVYALRAQPAHRDRPFILVSSETKPNYLNPVRQAGALAILPKPFTTAQLDKALGNVLEYLNNDPMLNECDEDFGALKVLIVDDSTTSRRLIRTVLEKIGFEQIAEAEDGSEAVPLINATHFDLVVTDYNMPHMDGKQLVEYIRTQSMQFTVPILMVSSETDQGRLAAVQDAGVSAVCDKPFDTAVIRQLVKQFVADRV
ncbi:MAG TPA: response regulator [Pseudogulbenkiania sp.]|nr:response regulator [Pseudogulbenkiania sp.]